MNYEFIQHYNRNYLLTIIYISTATAAIFQMTAPD